MPVRNGAFVERTPLTAAERHVDFVAHNQHIVDRRQRLERASIQTARRLGAAIVESGGAPHRMILQLDRQLEAGLAQTARFGYQQSRRELRALRTDSAVTAAWSIPDIAQHGELARDGLNGIRQLIRRRAFTAAQAIADAALRTVAHTTETDKTLRAAAAALAATKTLHNQVLELVGETLNLARTAGVLSLAEPPEFAMRSEQLDENTCPACDDVHGTIVEVDTAEFYAILPPSECFGGGRCRGLMVFGDGPQDVRQAFVQENPSRQI